MKRLALIGILAFIALCFFGCSEGMQKSTQNSTYPLISSNETELGPSHNVEETQSILAGETENAGSRFLEVHSGKPGKIKETDIRDFDPSADHGVSIEWGGIQDAKTASIIASAILEQYQSKEKFADFKLFSVEHDVDAGIWIMVFWEDNDYPGASLTIAIREKTAEIIGVWVGE